MTLTLHIMMPNYETECSNRNGEFVLKIFKHGYRLVDFSFVQFKPHI
jgi:hypothetical protein